jgi:hypothetical protein
MKMNFFHQIGQSLSIARFLAKKAGIAGKNEVEQALADGLVELVKDLIEGTNRYLSIQVISKSLYSDRPRIHSTTIGWVGWV